MIQPSDTFGTLRRFYNANVKCEAPNSKSQIPNLKSEI